MGKKLISRRTLLNSSLFVTLFGFAAAVFYPVVRFLWPPRGAGSGGSQTIFIPLNELGVGDAKMLRFQGTAIVVVRKENSVYALSAVCTHLGCIVKWERENNRLFCPCHAAIFDLNGNVLGGPAPRPLPTFQAKIVGDRIVVGDA